MREQPVHDVVIAGAGPAGATAAYFLAKGGKRVALLEKATFPRDKRCGDAWCEPALDILEEMEVIEELEAAGAVQWVRAGGLVSPSGLSFTSPDEGVRESAPRVAAIRRMVCDERIARADERVGAELIEDAAVTDVKLGDGRWAIGCKGGTHRFVSDGVLLYPPYALPGYVALFRHSNGDLTAHRLSAYHRAWMKEFGRARTRLQLRQERAPERRRLVILLAEKEAPHVS